MAENSTNSTGGGDGPARTSDPNAVLLARVAQGDKAAFAALFKALERPVYGFLVSRLNDSFEAADILNETFLEIWRSAGSFEGRSAAKTWIFGIAYRKMIDSIRKTSKVTLGYEMPEMEDESASAEDQMLASQSGAYLRDCLAKLTDEQAAAIRLAFYDDLSYREIAEITGVPEGTAKTRVFHAKKALAHCLNARITKSDIA